MPGHVPVSSSISRSNRVRESSRWARAAFLAPQLEHPRVQLLPDIGHGLVQLVLRHHVVDRREQEELLLLRQHLAARGIDQLDPIDFVPEELDVHRVLLVGRPDVQRIAPHSELASLSTRSPIACTASPSAPAETRAG